MNNIFGLKLVDFFMSIPLVRYLSIKHVQSKSAYFLNFFVKYRYSVMKHSVRSVQNEHSLFVSIVFFMHFLP